MKYRAFIFDMDGTMVDNMALHHRCWQKTLKAYGLDLSIAEVTATCHGRNIEIIERLFPGRFTLAERERISFEKEEEYRRIFLPDRKLVAGLPDLLEQAQAAGIQMGVGTAASIDNVNYILDGLDIRRYFRAVVDANDVEKGKPEPDVFFKAAALMGVAPAECLVFEDSPTGAKTALNAGMDAFIVTTTHQAEEFEAIPSVTRCIADYTDPAVWALFERQI